MTERTTVLLGEMKKSNIDYLMKRKFPPTNKMLAAALMGERPPSDESYLREIEEYRVTLEKKTPHEIFSLHSKECEKEIKEGEDRKEQGYFFNQLNAKADFDYWSKATYWTLEEAIALSFGKDPKKVSWKTIEQYSTSSLVNAYRNLRELAVRAKNWKKLFDPVYPIIFVKWTKDNDIPFPEQLEELVIKRAGEGKNWEQEYSKLEVEAKEHRNTIRIQQTYIEQLESQLAEAKNNQFIDGYMSPYMKLMQQAVIANKVTETNHQKKQTLIQWIKDNASEGLEISDNMAKSMATLMRSPEAKKGGNKKVS